MLSPCLIRRAVSPNNGAVTRPLFLLALLAALVTSVPASAQTAEAAAEASSPGWWVVPVTDDPEAADEIVAQVADQLQASGQPVVSVGTARERFEQRVSMPASALTQRQIDEWVATSRSAVRNLARADYEAAQADLQRTQQLSTAAAEELNRETARARQVLDTCLYMVRALIETLASEEAERQARECRRLVPRIEPSPHRHTPEVVEILERLDRAMAQEPAGSLRVRSRPDGCVVRLNGVELGTTPFALDDITQGTYRLQVECDPAERGRVHRVQVGEGVTHVTIERAFDEHVRSRPSVHITPGVDAAPLAQALAAKVGARVALVERQGGTWRVRPVSSEGAGAPVALPTADLVAALTDGVPESDADAEGPSAPTQPLPAWRTYTGIGVAVVGLAGVGLGVASHFQRATSGDRYAVAMPMDVDFLSRQSDWQGLGTRVYLFGALGGALLTAGAALALPERDGVPWWGWVSGALGLGALAGSIIAAVSLTSGCDNVAENRRECVDRGQEGGAAMLLGMSALPLLTVPLVYLIGRDPSGPAVNVDVGGEVGGMSLRLTGTF